MSMDMKRTIKGIYCPHCDNITYDLELKECPVCGKEFPPVAAEDPELVTFGQNDHREYIHSLKSGVVGLNDHRVYVLPEYDYCDSTYVRSFCDIIVGKHGKYAIVGGDGKVDFLFDDYCPRTTVNGQYIVRIADKVGCVDREGNVVVPIKFDYMLGDEAGIDGKTVFIDEKGQEILGSEPFKYTYCERADAVHHIVKRNLYGNYCVIDSFGEEQNEFLYYGFDSYEIENDVIKLSLHPQYGPGYFMPETWVEVFPLADFWNDNSYLPTCLFSVLGLGQFHEGLAQFKMYDNEELGPDEWGPEIHEGYVDDNWEVQIPSIYDQTSPFMSGFARVRKDNEVFFIDKNGNRVPDSAHLDETQYPFVTPASELKNGYEDFKVQGPIDGEYRDPRRLNSQLDGVQLVDGKYVYIDQYGRERDVIEVVPISELSEKHVGRMLAKSIEEHRTGDLVNEETGEFEQVQWSVEFIARGPLGSEDLQTLRESLEAGRKLDSMVVFVRNLDFY